jgi:hypothetical protein
MPSHISFDVHKRDDGITLITPMIDGISLIELAATFERSCGYTDPAGGYGGLIPEFFSYGPLGLYFLGSGRDFWTPRENKRPVLACECGEVGCWPLICAIESRDDTIVWHEFEQTYRPQRDYTRFGPFVFVRSDYETALQSLPPIP